MPNIDGAWNTVTKSPMGDQKGVLMLKSEGASFTGTTTSAMGAAEFTDGLIDGDTLSWSFQMTTPMPMTLKCSVEVSGDSFAGSVDTGVFGKMPITGVRG